MKKVLFIAYYFPPIGGSGTQRPVKFVKYLPQFGWQPYVISTDRPYGDGTEGRDETLLADIPPDVRVWRVPTPQPRPVQRLARQVGWRPRPPVTSAGAPSTGEHDVKARQGLPPSVQLRRALLSPLNAIERPPVDPALYWSLRIVPLARRIVETEQIDVVLTTSAPWSSLIAGALLQRLTSRPWIADFRDFWTDDPLIYLSTPIQRKLDMRAERKLIAQADAVISVTKPLVEGLRKKTSRRDQPFVLIPNGWDRDDFPALFDGRSGLPLSTAAGTPIVLLHPGSAYLGEPLPLLRAMELLNPQVTCQLRFHFIGHIDLRDRAEIEGSPYADRFVLDRQRVPHPEALRLMREAHVLLLLRRGPDASSGKIFEYMVSGRPVLAIGASHGVALQIVRQCGIGLTVDSDDVDELARLLQQISADYRQFVDDNFHPDWSAIEAYERRTLTSKLASTLDRVCRPK